MSRIAHAFSKKAKIAYLTAGDSGLNMPEYSAEYFLALTRAGFNVLEVGIPFSDPVADGPVIQLAMERALTAGIYIPEVLEIIRLIRAQSDAAIIVFTYLNPIMANVKQFLQDIKQAGADGILIVDLPLEESAVVRGLCNEVGLALIMVAAPSTSAERVATLSRQGSGFLYYACRKGTTGVKNDLPEEIIAQIKQVKQQSILPVAVGFGVSTPAMVKRLLEVTDGCVIGSYFVNAIAEGKTPIELEKIAKEILQNAD